ncbi:hypothetical protein LguiA_026189 [Lonicera macranthoides]
MEVEVISRDTIKPTSPTPPHLQPFKISFIDKIMPIVYIPFISFYPTMRKNSDLNHILLFTNHLKHALAEALTRFYPLAGRIKDDCPIDCNDKGLLFVTTLVNCDMSQLLAKAQPKIELFNQLALLWPEPNGEEGHQIALHPNFPAALLFPLSEEPELELMPTDLRKYWNVKWLLREGNGTVKSMDASTKVWKSQQPSTLTQMVDLLRRMMPPLSEYSVENIIWKTVAYFDALEDEEVSVDGLAVLLRQAVNKTRGEFVPKGETSDKIEAWLMLGHAEMAVLEHDPEFLAFANPNPPICFVEGEMCDKV